MQLPDEAIEYNYQGLLVPHQEEWAAVAELRQKHFLEPSRLRAFLPPLLQVRSQIAAERELQQVPADLQPLDAGFIDLPQKTLDSHRRKGEASDRNYRRALGDTLRDEKWDDGSGRPLFTVPVALSVMVFFALCCQCASTLVVIRRETNSWRWPVFTFVYMTALAYLGALLVYQIGTWIA